MDSFDETKWCNRCRKYVHYLRSLDRCYCVHCDRKVRLFSRSDMDKFRSAPVPPGPAPRINFN